MNFPAVTALVAAIVLLLASHHSDGGSMVSLFQPSAIMIVLGGTFCAALVNFKPSTLKNALNASLEVFSEKQPSHKVIEEIILVCKEDEISIFKKVFENESKVEYATGGNTRQDSVKNALSYIDEKYVLVHDGARPNFSKMLLERLKENVVLHGSVIPVISISDTIKVIKDNYVIKTLNREEIKRVQTPQAFETGLLKKAHCLAKNDGYTDDSSMIEELLEVPTFVVNGESNNIKYTNPEDF